MAVSRWLSSAEGRVNSYAEGGSQSGTPKEGECRSCPRNESGGAQWTGALDLGDTVSDRKWATCSDPPRQPGQVVTPGEGHHGSSTCAAGTSSVAAGS